MFGFLSAGHVLLCSASTTASSCTGTVTTTLWRTDTAAPPTSAPSYWPMGAGLTRAAPQTSGAWAYLCTPCWLDDTRFRTCNLPRCSLRSAAGPSACLIGFRHEPSVWLAACWGSHPQRDWRRRSCWCTRGWTIPTRNITKHKRLITARTKHHRLNKRTMTSWFQHGLKNTKTVTHNCTSILVRTQINVIHPTPRVLKKYYCLHRCHKESQQLASNLASSSDHSVKIQNTLLRVFGCSTQRQIRNCWYIQGKIQTPSSYGFGVAMVEACPFLW